MRGTLLKLLRDNRGATAIEYGLIVALVVIAIIGAVNSVADENEGMWADVTSDVLGAIEESESAPPPT